MRSLMLAVAAAAILAAVVRGAEDGNRPDMRVTTHTVSLHDVQLVLALPTQVPPDERLVVSVRFENRGREAISYLEEGPMFRLDVSGAQGQAVRETALGRQELGLPGGHPLALKPGEHVERQYDLTRWFVLSPGHYTLTVSRSFNEGNDDAWGSLQIKDAAFTIGKVENPFRTKDQ